MAIIWNTSSGSLGNIAKGELCNIALSCVGANVFSVIAGNLPIGLSLSGPFNNPSLPFPSIFGNTSTDAVTGVSAFTVRANDLNGNISDRGFTLNVLDTEPSYLFANSNIGTFADGTWAYATVAPLSATPNWPTNMTIVSGSLPANLSLNPSTGDITGYVSPSILYNSPFNQPNLESGKPNLSSSANSRSFSFEVQYDSQNTANYSMIIERQDLFNNGNANVSGPCYHDPIFVDATFDLTECSSSFPNIDLGMVDGDSILYQFLTEDYESNTIGYILVNGDSIPGNVYLNPITGWLSGYINRDLSVPPPYEFQVVAYKSANVFSNSGLQTTAFCTLTIENPADNNIIWNSASSIGNLYLGILSSLGVSASVIEAFQTPPIVPATANCTLKVVGVTIVAGGNAFANGSIFTVPGGICANSANIIVSNISPSGTITEVTIDESIIQQYSKLPAGFTFIWTNSTGNANALNAIFTVSFGVDEVKVLTGGAYFDTATVGFEPAGETITATGTALIYNGTISNVIVDITGENYQAIPQVTILGKALVKPTNPIKYELTAGTIPAGCNFLSNGLIVGLPSSRYFVLGEDQIEFNFSVTASIGQNRTIDFTETDLNGANVVTEDFQTLIQVTQDFSVNLQTGTNNLSGAPKTNLSLEFLLGDTDLQTLFTPLQDETIIPNGSIYRQDDFYFGIVPNVRMLLAYGISPEIADTIQEAIERYFQNKTYLFNGLKWAQSTSEGYEVIYIEPLDQFTNTNYDTFTGWINYNTPYGIKEAFPATTPNMIQQLNTHLNGFDYNFLPSWMRDVQPNGQIFGFVPAIPLVYVKPGTGKKILYYLQQYYDTVGPRLETIDAITDRLVWNAGYSQNWDSQPRVMLTAQNITAEIDSLSVSGANASYSIVNTTGTSNNIIPVGTTLVINGMTNPINNGKFQVTASTNTTFTVPNSSAITEPVSAGYAYNLNLNSNSYFMINSAVPLTYTPNLTPRTYNYIGNVEVDLPANITSISNIITIINNLNIDGIQAGLAANSAIFIENTYGCPFFIYDGDGTPLANLGLLSNVSESITTIIGNFDVGTTPIAVAVDFSGNVWSTNGYDNTVTKLSSSGALLGTFAVGTNPTAIVTDSTGNVWVGTSSSVDKLSSSGATLGTFVLGIDPYIGIAVDSEDNVWVPSSGGNTITKLSSLGSVLGKFTVGRQPYGVAIDSTGNVWSANGYDTTVSKLSSSGVLLGTFALPGGPFGIFDLAIDSQDNVWITSENGPNLYKLNSSGALIGTFNIGLGSFAVAIDSNDYPWITTSYNDIVAKLNLSGTIIQTFNGIEAYGIAIDSNDNVWTADVVSNQVTKIGLVTLLGSANISNVTGAGWWTSELTSFDPINTSEILTTEVNFDLSTENCIILETEGETYFTDLGQFIDVTDTFLNLDDGSIYIKFRNSNFINQPVVTV